ncbi:autophagy related lipase-like protein Atg15 [Lindgomyces ingoldianus]|uniref:Autophagy related lipase-like protein Atg15 n=1 Tax=Lindgomyces ingoldianus TaxID=673940 RepID=A0ACB6QLH9_9PLEO|nr:autophagy related lipase-like protein Atg15 [Lindgomyces ingoldianus]KAF2467157.1 autophagy related lipase-like protein Atg15 [Lindgomyces ingoldianus]
MPSTGIWRFILYVSGLFIFTLACLNSNFLFGFGPRSYRQQQAPPASSHRHGLRLRHVLHHGAGQPGPRARRLDVSAETKINALAEPSFGAFPIKMASIRIDRPVPDLHESQHFISPSLRSQDVPGPDVTCKETIISFASMAEDAYHPDPSDSQWLDTGGKYNQSIPFGWWDHGVRGHVFGDETNTTIVLSLKGTSVAVYEGNGTSLQDKDNDNLFGSCCCGQGGSYLWRKVCDCQTGTYTCNDKCVRGELREPNRYYAATLELYDEVIQLYPKANIITTGHSLGGVLASLIGLQHSVPSVTFEAYPQALAATRLGLPVSGDISPLRKNTGGFHFGHTADPVYMGTCNSASSFCSIGGYAFETLCHTGQKCVYDVVKDWGWRQSTSTHRLRYAIENVYSKYNETPLCQDEDVDCVDCYLWKFENGTHTKPTTTILGTSTTTTRTRTETCKTPGWWGCNDKPTPTTTVETTTSASVSTTSTNTCKTPGWFGCKDKTTSITSSSSSISTTATCTSLGWFGRCLDPTTTITTTLATEAAYWRMSPTPTLAPSQHFVYA